MKNRLKEGKGTAKESRTQRLNWVLKKDKFWRQEKGNGGRRQVKGEKKRWKDRCTFSKEERTSMRRIGRGGVWRPRVTRNGAI